MLDLIIRNGRVVDGKNHLNAITDLAVKDGKIVSVGSITESAAQEVDASGLLVIPTPSRVVHSASNCWAAIIR